jgi:hypothetical protein
MLNGFGRLDSMAGKIGRILAGRVLVDRVFEWLVALLAPFAAEAFWRAVDAVPTNCRHRAWLSLYTLLALTNNPKINENKGCQA